MSQNEMEVKLGLPERVRSNAGLGAWLKADLFFRFFIFFAVPPLEVLCCVAPPATLQIKAGLRNCDRNSFKHVQRSFYRLMDGGGVC